MQLTTIFAVVFSCLVLFLSIGYTNSSLVQGKRSVSYAKPSPHVAARRETPLIHNRRQFAGRAIVESLKQRRKH
jgi:hypothetical protein